MNVEYINPFVESTIHTFEAMVGIKPEIEKPRIEKELNLAFDISGIIGLTGKAKGTIIISFPKIVALKITSIITNSKITIIDEDVIDTIGELVNIIAGNAKQWLEKYELGTSLPGVVKGESHIVHNIKNEPFVRIPFKTEFGNFSLFVAFIEA